MAGFEPDFGRLDAPAPSGGGADGRRDRPPPAFGRPGAVAGLLLRLQANLEGEIESGRGFLWQAVAYAAGILGYCALPSEPIAPALAGATLVLAFAAWRLRHRHTAL
ncbi:MAG: hypothetical protein J0H54_01985, partial [Rhizobiales bacterium]|nr:hypothetical protein [Hyphomicrobiales bacterium]